MVELNQYWGAFKQTLIGYITGATNAYESAYDGIASMEMHLLIL
jgi:hypothetical protein